MKQLTWRAARATCVLAIVVMVAAVVAIAALVLLLVRGLGQPVIIITLLVLAAAGIGYLWRFALYPKLVLDERLTVVNPMRTFVMELGEARSVAAGPNGLRIVTDEVVVEAWCVQKSTGAIRGGRTTRADRIAEELDREIGRRHHVLSGGPSVPDFPTTATLLAPTEASDDQDATPDSGPVAPAHEAAFDTADEAAVDTADEAAVEPTSDHSTPEDDPAPEDDSTPTPTVGDEDSEDQNDEDDEDDLIIRRAHRDEVDVLVGLERTINVAALSSVFGTSFPTESVTTRWRETLADRTVKVRIAEIDGRPIGFVSFDATSIRQLGVLAAHARQGHGTALVSYAVADLERNGCSAPTLQVLEANQQARAFYTALGWRDTGDRTVCDYPPHPTEMRLVLADS